MILAQYEPKLKEFWQTIIKKDSEIDILINKLKNNNYNFNKIILMINFVKNSFRELKHVVWPTKAETRKYFLVVVSVLVLFGTYLFIFNNIFSYVIFFLKDALKNIL